MENIAWITGCTKGLGRAMTFGLAERGWTVAGCGRSEDRLAEMSALLSGQHCFRQADVGEEADASAFCRAVLDEVGPPDLLVNNAALMNEPASIWDVSAEEFDALMRVNVSGVANILRYAVPAMIEQGRGVIVNFSSGWGRSTSPQVAPYCATKWAIEGLSHALAQELPSGLAVVALNPGIIDTEMLRSAWNEGAAAYEGTEEWAERAVPFLEQLGVKDNGSSLSVP